MPGSSPVFSDADSDQQLLALVAAKNRDALARLYERHSARMYGIAIWILKHQDAAEDALHDAFLQIWNKADRFHSERGHPVGWMLQVCRNLCIDRLRASGARRTMDFASEWLEESVATAMVGPDLAAEIDELQAAVTEAIEGLPFAERRLVQLAYFGGHSQKEIAGQLGVPLGTVKTRMQKALRMLRSELEVYQS